MFEDTKGVIRIRISKKNRKHVWAESGTLYGIPVKNLLIGHETGNEDRIVVTSHGRYP